MRVRANRTAARLLATLVGIRGNCLVNRAGQRADQAVGVLVVLALAVRRRECPDPAFDD
jgi:hypothetical protein